MKIKEKDEGGSLWLNIEGKLDALSCEQCRDAILKAFRKNKSIVLNMERVPYISSAALSVLISGKKTADSKKGRLIVINPQPLVRDTLRVTGFDKLLDIR